MKKLFLLFTTGLLLLGCSLNKSVTPEADNIDYFNDATCNAPCVLGITPDITSETETKELIKNNPLLLNCHERDLTAQSGVRWIECGNFHVVFHNDMVDWISFFQPNLTIEQVIQKYGMPDGLTVDVVSLPDLPFRSAMVLRYDKIRMQVNLAETDGKRYEVILTTPVISIAFNNERRFETLTKTLQDLWVGYGIYPLANDNQN